VDIRFEIPPKIGRPEDFTSHTIISEVVFSSQVRSFRFYPAAFAISFGMIGK
jgi:hypothetical protein